MLLQLTLHSFIGNFLEPVAYLFHLAAVLIYANKYSEKDTQLLVWYYSLAFLLMAVCSVLVVFPDTKTVWLYNINAFVTVWLPGLYFRNHLREPLKKKIVTVLMILATLHLSVKNLVLYEFYFFDSIGYSLVSIVVVTSVLMYLHQLLNNVTEQDIFHDFRLWLSSCYLIYFLGSFVIFLTYYYFTVKIQATNTTEERYILTDLWGLHNLLLFVGALVLLFGSLWIVYRRKSVLL